MVFIISALSLREAEVPSPLSSRQIVAVAFRKRRGLEYALCSPVELAQVEQNCRQPRKESRICEQHAREWASTIARAAG